MLTIHSIYRKICHHKKEFLQYILYLHAVDSCCPSISLNILSKLPRVSYLLSEVTFPGRTLSTKKEYVQGKRAPPRRPLHLRRDPLQGQQRDDIRGLFVRRRRQGLPLPRIQWDGKVSSHTAAFEVRYWKVFYKRWATGCMNAAGKGRSRNKIRQTWGSF